MQLNFSYHPIALLVIPSYHGFSKFCLTRDSKREVKRTKTSNSKGQRGRRPIVVKVLRMVAWSNGAAPAIDPA